MNFLFWTGNHSALGQQSVEDAIEVVSHQLRALGHQAIRDPSNSRFLRAPAGYNVVVEGFNDEITGQLAARHAAGARFICLAMEEPTARGFNHGVHPEFVARQAAFAAAGPYLSGILHLVPGEAVTAWYRQHAPAAPAELGYAPGLLRREYVEHPSFDFGFYGTMSPRRLGILRRLAEVGSVKIITDMEPPHVRDVSMQDAKVIVQIRLHDKMGLVSSSRCNTALNLRRPVLAEPHALFAPWDEAVTFAESEEQFYDLAASMASRWQNAWERQYDAFKRALTPERCLGEPLRRLGVI